MLKKVFIVFFAIAFTTILISCGEDGSDGDAFIGFNWVGTVWYSDNIPSTPSKPEYGEWYNTQPGKYTLNYYHELNPGIDWELTFTISINKGTEGGLITDGEDGDDKYFEIGLWSDGPEVYDYSGSAPTFKIGTTDTKENKKNKLLVPDNSNSSRNQADKTTPSDTSYTIVKSEKIQTGKYMLNIVIKKRPVQE